MCATAVIAYWSDNLGKKLGKKRVSLLGLRPKQTATLITIASSLVIMLVTFGAMLAVYKPLQDALLRYDSVRANNVTERAKNVRLSQQNEILESGNTKLIEQNQVLQTQQGTVLAAKKQAEQEKKQAEQDKTKAIQSASDAQQRETEAKLNETKAKSGVKKAQKSLKTTRDDLRAAQEKLEPVQDELGRAQANLRMAQSAEKLAREEEKKAREEVRNANEDVVARKKEVLERTKDTLDATAKSLEAQAKVTTLQEQKTKLQADIEAFEGRVKALQKAYENELFNAFNEPVIVSWGETLAQQFVAPRLNEESIINLLRDLMRQARANVQIIGVRSGRPSLQTHIIETSGADEAAKIRFIASELASRPAASVVRVFAVRNHTAGDEAINAEFNVLPVDSAYRRDDIIATSVIDGSLGDAQVFNQLLRLLNEGERMARTEKRVIPPQGGDNKFYAEGTNERLFEALRAITLLKSSARVRLRAAEDLTTTAPLKVRFEVLPAS